MGKLFKRFSIITLFVLFLFSLVACDLSNNTQKTKTKEEDPKTQETDPAKTQETDPAKTQEPTEPTPTPTIEEIDYVDQLKLDLNSNTAKVKVTVKNFIDGDTTHFNVPTSVDASGVLKARYLAINTPESTGQIEEWGKAASNFTKSKLKDAVEIIVESDTSEWNLDSTGGRYLSWVWYKSSSDSDYRLLNLEILQNGLAIASNTGQNRYGTTCLAALNQAKALGLHIFSGQPDPDYYYGDQIELSLKELRLNVTKYSNCIVAFDATIIKNYSNALYVEDYDEETGIYYGMYIYYGFNLSGGGLSIIRTGNRCRIVGSLQYYEAGNSYQIADLQYNIMDPDNARNIQLISKNNTPAYTLVTPEEFVNGKVTVKYVEEDENGEEKEVEKNLDFVKLALYTSVSMENLEVIDTYTTSNPDSSSNGAITLTCRANGLTISVRTIVLYDSDDQLVTADRFEGKTINVRGVIDCYDGQYQIKVFNVNDIEILD